MDIFVHIPSSGGTTLWSVLRAATHNRVKRIRAGGLDRNVAALRQTVAEGAGDFAVIGGHLPVGALDGLDDGTRYFTFMREPCRRVESDYFRKLRNGRIKPPTDTGAGLVRHARRQRAYPLRLLTGLSKETVEANYDSDAFAREVIDRVRERFALVGFTEAFDESLVALAKLLGWRRVPAYDRRNRGGNKVEIDPGPHGRMSEILHLEQTVYQALRADFQARRPGAGLVDGAALASLVVRSKLRRLRRGAGNAFVKG